MEAREIEGGLRALRAEALRGTPGRRGFFSGRCSTRGRLHEKVGLSRGDPRFSELYEKIFALLLVEGSLQ